MDLEFVSFREVMLTPKQNYMDRTFTTQQSAFALYKIEFVAPVKKTYHILPVVVYNTIQWHVCYSEFQVVSTCLQFYSQVNQQDSF